MAPVRVPAEDPEFTPCAPLYRNCAVRQLRVLQIPHYLETHAAGISRLSSGCVAIPSPGHLASLAWLQRRNSLEQQGFGGQRHINATSAAQLLRAGPTRVIGARIAASFVPTAPCGQSRKSSKRHRISPSSLMAEPEIFRCTNAIDSCYFLAHAIAGPPLPGGHRVASPAGPGRAAPRWRTGRRHYRSVPLAFVDAASGRALPRRADNDCPWCSTPFSRSSAVTLSSPGVSSRADEHERKTHVLRHC